MTKARSLGALHSGLDDSGVVLVVDVKYADGWKGEADDRFEDFVDLGSSEEAKKREQKLGSGRCLLVPASVDTQVFAFDDGFGWMDFLPHDTVGAAMKKKLAEAMLSMKAKGKPRLYGKVTVESRCVALVMAHAAGKVTPAAVAKAIGAPEAIGKYAGGNLLAVPNGTYAATYDRIERETDDGFFQGRLRFVKEG